MSAYLTFTHQSRSYGGSTQQGRQGVLPATAGAGASLSSNTSSGPLHLWRPYDSCTQHSSTG